MSEYRSKEEQDKLVKKLLDASSQIHNSQRSPANYMITGSQVGEQMKEYFEEIERKEKVESRNKKIDDLLDGEE